MILPEGVVSKKLMGLWNTFRKTWSCIRLEALRVVCRQAQGKVMVVVTVNVWKSITRKYINNKGKQEKGKRKKKRKQEKKKGKKGWKEKKRNPVRAEKN